MSDQEFVAITTQLLRGERRYRLAMLQVLEEVEEPEREGGSDVLAEVRERGEDEGEAVGTARQRV